MSYVNRNLAIELNNSTQDIPSIVALPTGTPLLGAQQALIFNGWKGVLHGSVERRLQVCITCGKILENLCLLFYTEDYKLLVDTPVYHRLRKCSGIF